MNNYDIYELITEELQNRVDSEEITLEFAESVNDLAYDKYVSEDKSDIKLKYNKDRFKRYADSKMHCKKRPRIEKDMLDIDRIELDWYDHGGDKICGSPEGRSLRAYAADVRGEKQTAKLKRLCDANNEDRAKIYED